MTDTLARWERWPVVGLLIAAGINTAVWYVGASLAGPLPPPAQWMLTAGGATAILAIDGALVATVAGMREGRRSRWSTANVLVTALFTAAAALSAHGVVDGIGGALHALFAATIVTYAMHLAQPRHDATVALALREQEVSRRAADLDGREAALAAREQAVTAREQAPIRVEQVETVRVATRELTWGQLERLVGEAVKRQATSVSSLRRMLEGVE